MALTSRIASRMALRRRKALWSGVGLMACASLAVTMAPAGAAESPEGPNLEYSSFELSQFAEDRGIDRTEARRLLDAMALGRVILEQDVPAVVPGAFGDGWFDESGKLNVALPRSVDTAQLRERLTQRAKARGLGSTNIAFYTTQWTGSHLRTVNDELASEISQANAGATAFLGGGLAPDLSVVELLVPANHGDFNAKQRSLVEGAPARWHGAVRIRASDSTTFTSSGTDCTTDKAGCDPPLRGGVLMDSQNGNSCTAGFHAKSNLDGKSYVMLAGHCVRIDRSDWFTYQKQDAHLGPHRVGTRHNHAYGSAGDYGIINIYNVPGWNPKNWVWVVGSSTVGGTTEDERYYIAGTTNVTKPDRVCHTGVSQTDCGEVVAIEQTRTDTKTGITVSHLVQSTMCESSISRAFGGGDSGGPVYSGHQAQGLYSGSSYGGGQCESYHQPIKAAAHALNVTVVTTAS